MGWRRRWCNDEFPYFKKKFQSRPHTLKHPKLYRISGIPSPPLVHCYSRSYWLPWVHMSHYITRFEEVWLETRHSILRKCSHSENLIPRFYLSSRYTTTITKAIHFKIYICLQYEWFCVSAKRLEDSLWIGRVMAGYMEISFAVTRSSPLPRPLRYRMGTLLFLILLFVDSN